MLKFPKIQQLHSVIKLARRSPDLWAGERRYLGTVKLHGRNAGARVRPNGEVVAQSRNRVLSVGSDNMGFAAFVAGREAVFCELAEVVLRELADPRDPVESELGELDTIGPGLAQGVIDVPALEPGAAAHSGADVVLFGEWVGQGIQKGVAVSRFTRRWVLFGAAIVVGEQERFVDTTPLALDKLADGIDLIHGGPYTEPLELLVDLTSPASCSRAVDTVSEATRRVEERCPWSAERGVDGIGEGLVWRPAGLDARYTDLWFKTKGGLHRGVSAARSPATLAAEQHASIDAFVASVVDEARVKQGLDHVVEADGEASMRSTGALLQWLADDIQAEQGDELAASGLTWKAVAKAVNAAAMPIWRRLVA